MSELSVRELFDLSGKVAIVTGGGGDIGAVYGLALAEAGARVVLADLAPDRAKAAAEKITAAGYEALGVSVDITSDASAAAMAASATERFGGIDILVNNAALMTELPRKNLMDLPTEWFERVLRVNTMGAWICAKAVAPSMRARGFGRIVNGSSGGAFTRRGIYAISKYALHSLTACMATELGPQGINVNAIAPGFVDSDSGHRALAKDDPARAMIAAGIPGKMGGPPRDLVGALLLLCSPAGDWINGQTISVDGGWIMRL
jgi:NAD(P)-dependent dehydrogenase (short-subunit alcohol dehydrogenase family)